MKITFSFLSAAFFILFSAEKISAQNLVPNPSFEDTISCVVNIDSVEFWHNPNGYSPDYFNSNMQTILPYNDFKVPLNLYGYQTARTGHAYAGIITKMPTDCREYIQAQLTDTLITGKKYAVTFYVCVPDSSPYAVNDIGAYFSNNAISSLNIQYFQCIPQINNSSVLNPLNQFDTWLSVSDTFIANGGEKYITIGNFKNDAATDTTNFNYHSNIQQYGYDYVDDVSVFMLDSTSGIYNLPQQQIAIYPNPATEQLIIDNARLPVGQGQLIIKGIEMFDLVGRKMMDDELLVNNSNHYSLNTKKFPRGYYFIRIHTSEGMINRKIVLQ